MEIIFYQYSGEKNVLNKVLAAEITLTGHLVEETSLIDPVITVALNTNLTVCNYCYIPAFGRYYYITDITALYKELRINLHCDVLMSFKDEILASKGVIGRTNIGDNDITDNMVMQTPKVIRQCQKIGTPFTKREMYVLQIGG